MTRARQDKSSGWGKLRRAWRPAAEPDWPARAQQLMAELAGPGDCAAHHEVLRRMLLLPAQSPFWAAMVPHVGRLVSCLSSEWVGPDSGQLPAVQDINLVLFGDYTAALRRIGQPALGAMRRLLDGPCAPVNTYGHEGAPQSHFGPKLTALAVVQTLGDSSDCALLERLVSSKHEDRRTCAEAALVWAQWEPLAAAKAAARWCLASLGRGTFDRSVAPRLALLGAPLVPALLARLTHADTAWQARAEAVLIQMGDVAVPELADYCRAAQPGPALDFASRVLARLDRRAAASASLAQPDPRRGLSAAELGANPARGLGLADFAP